MAVFTVTQKKTTSAARGETADHGVSAAILKFEPIMVCG
jgi:hypothetical protein